MGRRVRPQAQLTAGREAVAVRIVGSRGLDAVSAEWSLACTAHNLLKLATAGRLA